MTNIITPGLALKAAVPGDDRRGGDLTTNNTISETNKFGIDAVELNPNIEGSMAHDIVEVNNDLANSLTNCTDLLIEAASGDYTVQDLTKYKLLLCEIFPTSHPDLIYDSWTIPTCILSYYYNKQITLNALYVAMTFSSGNRVRIMIKNKTTINIAQTNDYFTVTVRGLS